MRLTTLLAALSVIASMLLPSLARAGEGHDHGDAAPVASGPSLPRFAAVSDAFELVGVLNGKQLTLYLDRAADNAPVTEAQIELEIGGAKVKAEKHEDAFEVVLADAPKPGVLPITATVTVGNEVDLLASELDLHEEAHADEAAHVHSWKEYAGWATAALGTLVVLILIGRNLAARRQRRTGAAA
ncbi:hypothetical protein ACU6VJ_11155 [Sphaerotilus sulfidivorans]|jgi:hypothetical protein|nr:hypothetical protein CQA4T8M7_37080 [Sphaerotilus natans]HPG78677.1 hypothetical protein [Piscinibacter sp.]